MDHVISKRKIEHVEALLADTDADRSKDHFGAIVLKHHALPGLAINEVDSSIRFLGKRLAMPFLISSMTGGSGEKLLEINRNLAVAAERAGVALAVGSQRVMFSEKSARKSFELREYAPTTAILANLGAVQLNYGFGVEECREAVRILDADALILHLNPLQEICQRDGNTDFRGLAERIGEVAGELDVPVVIKEVGGGVCEADVDQFIANGVEIVDVAGAGGVSWSRVEENRNAGQAEPDNVFDDWGIPTPVVLDMLEPYLDQVDLIASGGLRSGVDMAKAIVLGASLCGMAMPLLKPALESADAILATLNGIEKDLQKSMFLLGCRTVAEMKGRKDLIVEA